MVGKKYVNQMHKFLTNSFLWVKSEVQRGLWGDIDKGKKSLLLSIQFQAAVILVDENTSYDLLMASVWLLKKNASPKKCLSLQHTRNSLRTELLLPPVAYPIYIRTQYKMFCLDILRNRFYCSYINGCLPSTHCTW